MRLVVECTLAGVLLVAAAFGCGPTIYVTQPARPTIGRVSIEVTDRREPKRGGADPSQIGIERNGWGIPVPILLDGPAGLMLHAHGLFSEAAASTDLGVLAMGDLNGATSRLMLEVQSYWCDGYFPVFKAHAVVSATIIDGLTGQVRVPGQPLTADGEAGDCHAALQRMRRALYENARGFFVTPQLRAALVAEPALAAPPPPPPAPPPSGPPPQPPPQQAGQPMSPY
jgi:hypothetical protein